MKRTEVDLFGDGIQVGLRLKIAGNKTDRLFDPIIINRLVFGHCFLFLQWHKDKRAR